MNVLKSSTQFITQVGEMVKARQHPDKRVEAGAALVIAIICIIVLYLYLTA